MEIHVTNIPFFALRRKAFIAGQGDFSPCVRLFGQSAPLDDINIA
jgi:hypothetical protein